MVAVCQIRHPSIGRTNYDRRLGEGKTKKDALPSLKRHISIIFCRQLIIGAN